MNSKSLYKQFCRHCYLNTSGWLPMTPVFSKLALGDFGQIHQGRFKPLGNIQQFPLQLTHSDEIALDAWQWQMESDVEKITSNHEAQYQNQSITFKQKSDFIFHCTEPKARWLYHWADLKPQLILNFTQLDYSFRELCIISAITTVNDWGLVIAATDNACFEWAAQTDEQRSTLHLNHTSATLLQSQHIACFEKSAGRDAYFFKAKKLVLSDKTIQDLQRAQPTWSNSELINLIPPHQLTVDTCLDYFDWADVTLDDVEP